MNSYYLFQSLKNTIKNKNFFKLIISILILLFLMKLVNYQVLYESIKNINISFLLVFIILPFSLLLRAWRWMIIINKDEKHISIKDSFSLTLVGVSLNIFLPASSGDIAKSYYGYKWHGVKEEMLSSSVVDKIIALLTIFFIGTLSALALKIYSLFIFSLIITIALSLLVFLPQIIPWNALNYLLHFVTQKRLDEKKLESSFKLPNKIKLIAFVISVIAWLTSYSMFLIICNSFGVQIDFIYILAVASLMNLAIIFPFTLNGIGSGEAMVLYLFGLVNISPTLAIVISLIYSQLITTIIPGLFGLLIIWRK